MSVSAITVLDIMPRSRFSFFSVFQEVIITSAYLTFYQLSTIINDIKLFTDQIV